MDKEKTGIFVKEQREKCNLTQNDLARKINTSRENISKWERGLAVPNTEYLKKLCEVLNCDVIDLLTAGERNEKIDKIIYDLMDRHVIFVKKVFYTITAILFLVIFTFLTNYFCQNYNSIKIYNISGEMNGYKVINSTLIVNKKKCFFTFSGFVVPDDEEIKKITIYYDDINDANNIIFESDKSASVIFFDVDTFDIDELENNLNVQMITSNNIINFKLDVYLCYKNNHLLAENKNYLIDEDIGVREDLPSYIDDNFVYDYKTDSYIYSYLDDDTEVKIEYDYSTKAISISETKDDLEISLSIIQRDIILFVNSLGSECIYDTNKKVCINSKDAVENVHLIETYLNKYKKYLS